MAWLASGRAEQAALAPSTQTKAGDRAAGATFNVSPARTAAAARSMLHHGRLRLT